MGIDSDPLSWNLEIPRGPDPCHRSYLPAAVPPLAWLSAVFYGYMACTLSKLFWVSYLHICGTWQQRRNGENAVT
jgi:hypothetical protein